MMKKLSLACLCVISSVTSSASFAEGERKSSTQASKAVASDIAAEACGVTFDVPRDVRVVLVSITAEPPERCKMALIKGGRSKVSAEKGVVPGYQELSDLVLSVRAQPVLLRLPDFNYVVSGAEKSVCYAGQALTDSAAQFGYSTEIEKYFRIETKKLTTLYVGEAAVWQRKSDGSKKKA